MLGTGLGKKVDAQFVKNAYNSFLKKEDPPKKPRTQEERRAECRRKGIFVAADDDEMEPTTFEQPAVGSRPAKFKNAPKPLKWKKPSTLKAQNKQPERKDEAKPSMSSSSKSTSTSKIAYKSPAQHASKQMRRKSSQSKRKPVEQNPSETMTEMSSNRDDKPSIREEKPNLREEKPSLREEKPSLREEKPSLREEKPSLREKPVEKPPENIDKDVSLKMDKTQREGDESIRSQVKQLPSDHVVEDAVAMAVAMAVELKTEEAKKVLDAEPKPQQMSPQPEKEKQPKSGPLGEIEVLAKTPEHSSYTLREPVHSPPTGGIRRDKEAAFGKLEDDEFEKMLEQENARCAETDKDAVKTAKKILKTAYREKLLDKVLTKEESEILVKFFSGKIPYDQKVLQILDRALDKTIDCLESRRVKMSAETQEVVNQRVHLKRALFHEFLINPQYMPSTWAKKYEELRQQSTMETVGINWARVLLCYPTQKSFGDGPMDEFGNFTRRKRHWLLAMIIGPSDSKTFAETQREEVCRGMYFDTGIMEKAKTTTADDVSLSSTRRPVT